MTAGLSFASDEPVLPAMQFDWFPRDLPAGVWPIALREDLCAMMKAAGWNAVQSGEFEPLARLYNDFVSAYPRLMVDRSDVDRAADLYTLLYTMLWRRTQLLSDLTRFNDDVVRPFAGFVSRHFPKQALRPATRDVPRIAYLSETSDLFGSNAIARITVSLMLGQQELREPADRPILYCLAHPVPALWDFADEHGLEVRALARATPSETTQAVLAQMAADEIDILVTDANCAVATMVMQRRPARVQAFHENGFATWAIPELDLAFLGITRPTPGLFDPRVAVFQTPRNTAFVFQTMERPQDIIEDVRSILRAETGVTEPSTVYGVYGRMAKLTADYMTQVEAILLRDPQAIFFAGGTGCATPVLACKESSPAGERMIVYNDFIDGHVIAECIDVFLDSFPFPGGMSCVEVQARGVPVVWMTPPPGDDMAIIGEQRDARLKAADGAAYVDLALGLGDRAARTVHGEAALEIARGAGDMRAEAEMVETYLRAAWDRVRHEQGSAA